MSPPPSSSSPPPKTAPFPHRRTDDARCFPPYPSNLLAAYADGGYFAQQALQGELRSSQSHQFHGVNPMFFGQAAGFFGGQVLRRPAGGDQARREAEKQRIREELLAREAMWRRELEEEVMQELALERERDLELALRRRQSNPVPMPSSSSILSPESARPILAPHLRESLFREKLLQSLRGEAEGGLFQRAPEERRTVNGGGFGGPKPVFQVRRRTEETAAGPSISAVKRIFSPSSASADNDKSLVPKKARKEWNCDICQVTASSVQVFNDHLGGKKHKLKEAEISGGKSGTDHSNGKSEEMVNSGTKKMQFTTRKDIKRPNKQRKIKHHADENVDQFKKNKKNASYFCECCGVECFSEIVMAGHYKGKKHKFRMEQLRKSLDKNSNEYMVLEELLKEEAAGVVTSDNEDKRSEVGEKEVNDKLDLDVGNEEVVKESLKVEAAGVVTSDNEDKRSEFEKREINDTLNLDVGNEAVVKEVHEMAYLGGGSDLVDGESDQVKINELRGREMEE